MCPPKLKALPPISNKLLKPLDFKPYILKSKGLIGTEEVKLGIVKAFKELLGDLGDWRASLKGLNFSRLNDMEALSLEVPFTEEEVLVALA